MGNKTPNFGRGLKKARKRAGYKTQPDFAKSYHRSIDTVQNWEQGKFKPRLDEFLDLCQFFNCDADYLLDTLDERTHEIDYICKYTGLSSDAVEALHHLSKSAKPENKRTLTFLNRALSKLDYKEDQDNFFETIFSMLERYVQARNQNFLYISDGDSPNGYNTEVFDLKKSELSLGRASEKLIEILDFPEIYRASIIARITNLLNEYAQEEEGR